MNFKLLLVVLITIAASPSMGQAKVENGAVEIYRGEGKNLKGRMERIEAKSQRQEKEIEVLKTSLEEEKNFSKQLSGRILQLEASANQNYMENDQLLRRSKRSFRLLSPQVPLKNENKDDENNQPFFGPATNCNELGLLGHTLNGYYLVKKTTDSTKSEKIGIAYCRFQQLQGQNEVLQKIVGTVEVKTKSVHFYVQRDSILRTENAIIPFELVRLNEGDAFNATSGIFTAPVKGIYHFQLSAFKDAKAELLYISLQVNGVDVGIAFTRRSATGGGDLVSLSSSLRLAAGDRVNLLKSHGVLYDNKNHLTHFSGWLVEEELI